MISAIEEIIADFRQGKMVILIDDENRENEGDIFISAKQCNAEAINFMATHARGLICLTLTEARCQQLDFPLMIGNNSNSGTNFTVSIDAANSTTGISAKERSETIIKAVSETATAADFIQPGHVFPLMARQGGTLVRAGHTEAGCDLSRLAGEKEPASVIVEIMNADGTMARLPDLEIFAESHQIKLGTIADLIRYRMRTENLVQLQHQCQFPTRYGMFTLHLYRDTIDQHDHIALTHGDYANQDSTMVRVHMQLFLHDALCGERESSAFTLSRAMEKIVANGHGVIVCLKAALLEMDLLKQIEYWEKQDQGDADVNQEWVDDNKTFGKGASILYDLGVRKMVVLGSQWGNNLLSGFELEVERFIK